MTAYWQSARSPKRSGGDEYEINVVMPANTTPVL